MYQQSEGKNLTLIATADLLAGVPITYGSRLIVPNVTVKAGRAFSAETSGIFLGHDDYLADGVTPDYQGESAYWIVADSKLTTAKTTDKNTNLHVGYFVKNLKENAFELGI